MTDKLISIVWHWQVGMLRRPEMDDENGFCYEEADGDLIFTKDPRYGRHMRLSLWQTPEGERYTTLSKVPCPTHRFSR